MDNTTPFLKKIVYFRAFRFDWYMYKKKRKMYTFYFLSTKGAKGGGGQSIADMSSVTWIKITVNFFSCPNILELEGNTERLYITFNCMYE